ncbi:hypothetical protein MTO96_018039 [Rhipicephalus appendiculatus]
MQRMRQGDVEYYHKYYRMMPHQFDFLLRLLQQDLQRKHVVREPISPAERLAMTLRYLSSGDLVQDIALAFRVGISTARMAVKVTCRALWKRLQPLYMAGTFSIVLLAVVDCNYKFVMVDVGAYGKESDGGVREQSKFRKRLEQGKLHLPKDLQLPNTTLPTPCVFVGDEAFHLRTDFLRPYPGRGLDPSQRVFNYRLNRAR